MVTVLIPGGGNQPTTTTVEGFINYGDASSPAVDIDNYPIWLVMPFSGQISGLSLSIATPSTSPVGFSLYNFETNHTANIILTTGKQTEQLTLGSLALPFSAGDRLTWFSGEPLPSTANIFIVTVDLDTPLPYPIITSSCSLSGTNQFIANDFPYSFGSGAHNNSPSMPDVEFVVPEICELMALSFSANESNAVVTTDSSINVYINDSATPVTYTVASGNNRTYSVFTTPQKIQLLPGDRIKIGCATSNPNLNHSVVTLFMQNIS